MLVPGVGKRTAQRLLVELKSRLEVPTSTSAARRCRAQRARAEVREALTGLGYSPDEVRDGARATRPTTATVEELLRDALAAARGEPR